MDGLTCDAMPCHAIHVGMNAGRHSTCPAGPDNQKAKTEGGKPLQDRTVSYASPAGTGSRPATPTAGDGVRSAATGAAIGADRRSGDQKSSGSPSSSSSSSRRPPPRAAAAGGFRTLPPSLLHDPDVDTYEVDPRDRWTDERDEYFYREIARGTGSEYVGGIPVRRME